MHRAPRPVAERPRRGIAYLPAAIWFGIILYVGTRPDLPSPPPRLPIDKFVHLGMYGVLGWLTGRGWVRARKWPAVALPLLVAIAAGAFDEINQQRVVTRTADPIDWLMDVVGILAGFALVAWSSARAVQAAKVKARTSTSKESE